jgi:nucleotide-binding universal stress UspA family protein
MSGRIVVGVDGSDNAAAALDWAVREAARRGASVEAVAVWNYPAVSLPAGLAPMLPGRPQAAQVFEELLGVIDRSPAAELGVDITPTMEEGNAGRILEARSAEDDVVLVVVGARTAHLGSVSNHVAQHASCPVVVVRGG